MIIADLPRELEALLLLLNGGDHPNASVGAPAHGVPGFYENKLD